MCVCVCTVGCNALTFSLVVVGMDRRTEDNLREKEAGGPPVCLHQGAGDLQQPVRKCSSTGTMSIFICVFMCMFIPPKDQPVRAFVSHAQFLWIYILRHT